MDLVCAPKGLEIGVGEAIIHDPATPPELEAGAIVLGVGVMPRGGASQDAVELLRRAGAAGAAAVALKLWGDTERYEPDALRQAAERAGVALLAVPTEMTWSQAHSLVRTALASVALPDEADATTFPLGDLFALANAVAAMVGGAVTIEDRQSRVLAYSSQSEGVDEPRRQTILGRRVPDEWLQRLEDAGVFARLWEGELVRYVAPPELDLYPRLAIAIRARDVILGSIWVSEGEVPLTALAEDALRDAARIAALHLIKHRAVEDLERSSRGDLLRVILEGRAVEGGSGGLDEVAYGLGVPADGTFAVLAFEPQSPDDVESALARERVLDLVGLYGETFRQRSAVAQLGRTIYVLLPGPDPERPARLLELGHDIVSRAYETLGVSLRAGIGGVVSHLRDVASSRREADQVLRALAQDPASPAVADFASSRGQIALLELRDFAADRPHLRSQGLATLHRHDAEHSTSYIHTLRCYLDAFGDVPRAAALASVHPNTLRYRLRRLVELSGVDLADPQSRLLVELELRLGLNGLTERSPI